MTIKIKPTATTATIEHNDSTILTVDSSGNITPSNQMYPKVPSFSVKKTSNQSISSSTYTKCTWSSENWDIGSGFDITNSKFQPTVAGYYNLTVNVRWDGSTSYTRGIVKLFKNGSAYKRIAGHNEGTANQHYNANGTCLIYMNGSTDYAEVYVYVTATTAVIGNSNVDELIWWDGHLVSV